MATCLRPLEALGGSYDLGRRGEVVARNCLFREACDAARVVREVRHKLETGRKGAARPRPPGGA